MNDIISLKKIEIFAHHGVYPEEQTLGQKFMISVDLMGDFKKICQSDLIKDGFCYGDMTQKIVHFCTHHRFHTLEGLSHALGKYLFFINKFISNINITIEKPNAPISYHLESVSITIHRNRDDYRDIPCDVHLKELA